MKKIGTCRLCLEQRELVNSHIVPKFFYKKELLDEEGKCYIVNPLTGRVTKSYGGEFDPNILCGDCDNRIIGSELEDYACKAFFDEIGLNTQRIRKDDGLEYIDVKNLDYKKFKLFLISLLWRTAVSSRSFSSAAELGPHQEKMREMIISGDPGPQNKYPCIISSYRGKDLPKEIIGGPRQIRYRRPFTFAVGYTLLINGFLFMYRMLENERDRVFLEASVNIDGHAIIPLIPEDQGRKVLNVYMGKTTIFDK